MNIKKDFDEVIKEYFNNTAEKINCEPCMLEKIEAGFNESGERNKTVRQDNLRNRIVFLNLNRKRAVLAALCFSIVMSSGIFAFSEDARVWAKESLDKVTSFVYTVVYTKDGYKAVKTPEDKVLCNKNIIYHETLLPDNELSKVVGFKVKVPARLDNGYGLRENAYFNYESDKSMVAFSTYTRNDTEFYTFMQADSKNPLIGSFYNLKPVKIGEVDGYWAETPYPVYPGNDPHNMPTDIKISYCLFWINNGVYNIVPLVETSQEENCVDFAKAIVNAKDAPYQIPEVYKPYKTWTPFMYKPGDDYELWVRGRVHFQYKIPDKLAESHNLKQKGFICKLPENFQNQFTEDVRNLIGASYTDGSDRTQVNLVVSDMDSIVSDWAGAEIVSVGNTKAYWGKQTKKDYTATLDPDLFKTSMVNTDTHYIAWKEGSVYYKIYMEKGDFSSREEAVKYAESVINSKK